jgi:hypothetical protein
MLYGPHGSPKFGTVMGREGARHLSESDFEISVLDAEFSQKSGRLYPSKWAVRIPGAIYTVTPYFKDQEIVAPDATYWEGICTVEGESGKVGYAYVELTGYAEQSETDMAMRWAMGDRDAAALMGNLGSGSQIADDFVDGEVALENASEKMTDLLTRAVTGLAGNPFYVKHRERLEPVILAGLLNWDLSNGLVKSKNSDSRVFAYALRESLEQIVGAVALIVGGISWARRAIRECHEFYHGERNGENFEKWVVQNG